MDIAELRSKTAEELKELRTSHREELRVLRFKARGGQLKQVHKIAQVRKHIARINTLLCGRGSE